jgi:P pilus assembly chaperone PapD
MKKSIIFLCIIVMSISVAASDAYSLRITLKRVVFEGPKRAEVITVINNKEEEVTYRLGWRHFVMTEEESLVAIEDGAPLPPEVKPVVDMVRFAPRRFTIPPKSSQQIRMMLRTPANLADGEYRSHFWVRPEADVEDIRKSIEREQSGQEREGGVTMKMLAGVTMPVIVRKGNLEVSAEIQNLQAQGTPGVINVSFYLARMGNKSMYGDIDYICNNDYVIRTSRGNAVYTEVNGRQINLRIARPQDKPACQNITVRYYETDKFMGKQVSVLAEASAPVR